MNTVRFKFQSEICDLKSEIDTMVLKFARGEAVIGQLKGEES
jgi:hypothetical protein